MTYDEEEVYRQACWELLRACFNGARKNIIRQLAEAMWELRTG